ncbi:hypothetical protein ceV_250 [Chrysochromulina ericina virus CeV-01B]|uniref:Uncharacterized protein n=1 Tax=Chrysochromulina ericina virus CeV-01B TaxID=3070830 RepID=A0A0N9QYG6_9VIRU|nr:hypothetical protein ceV_250 [Chrysochromulina ericina virus]ALH23156.1 hypothetical protein ceV_250 [Chrysochromulina ericina virus CeV-01B]
MCKYYMKNYIIFILTVLILIYSTTSNNYIENFDNIQNISGRWNSKDLKSGPITLNQNRNIITASYPMVGNALGLVLDDKIFWKIEDNGKEISGKLIKDQNGNNIIRIIWDNNVVWNREDIPAQSNNIEQPFVKIPDMEGKWYGTDMKSGPLVFRQNNNIITIIDKDLGSMKALVTNNKIILNNKNNKVFGTINILNDKVESIKWENNLVWKKLMPAVSISGQWKGTGLDNGPINITQYGNIVLANYPGYGMFEGTIINNLISGKWSSNEHIINGTLVKNNNKIDTIKWGENIQWNKIPENKLDNLIDNKYNIYKNYIDSDIDNDCVFGRIPQHLVS